MQETSQAMSVKGSIQVDGIDYQIQNIADALDTQSFFLLLISIAFFVIGSAIRSVAVAIRYHGDAVRNSLRK